MNATHVHSVLLIDDHRLTYEGVAAVLAGEPDLRLLSHVSHPGQAVQIAQLHKPDLALVDICMPGINGVDVTRALRSAAPFCRVLALSAYDDPYLVGQMIEAGARGYVLKSQAGVELVDALRTVLRGDLYLKAVEQPDVGGEKRGLSERERQLLRLIGAAKTNSEMAHELGISVSTVETHRRRIMRKLGIDNAVELVRAAMQLGR